MDNDKRPTFISTGMHGVLDYLVGIALIAAPWIFGFSDSDAATWVAVGSGIGLILLSLITDYELSIAKIVPMGTHLMLDALLGVFLIASPWLFDFYDLGTEYWLPHVLVGAMEIGVAAVSESRAQERQTARTAS